MIIVINGLRFSNKFRAWGLDPKMAEINPKMDPNGTPKWTKIDPKNGPEMDPVLSYTAARTGQAF